MNIASARLVGIASIAVLAVAGSIAATGASPAEAAAKTAVVKVATQKMTGPYLPPNFTQKGTYAANKKVTLKCHIYGQLVSGWGGSGNIWYQLSDGYYVAGVDLSIKGTKAVGSACPTISLKTLVSQTKGKTWANTAGKYSGECVSFVSWYLYRVHGIKRDTWGNAVEFKNGGAAGKVLKSLKFTWSTSKSSFKNGDILVWSDNGGSGPGHVGIWYEGKVYDQNDGRHSPARTTNYSGEFWSKNYLGRWRK